MVSVFCGLSLDGFLARPDDTFDFLPPVDPGEFKKFYKTVDAVVIGRRTYEVVLRHLPKWFYGRTRVVVLSTRKLDFSRIKNGRVEQMSGSPARIVAKLQAGGARHLYVDGGITIQKFLRAGLVDRLIISRVPVLIGEGVPLFGRLPDDVKLRHVRTRILAHGVVMSEYLIRKKPKRRLDR